MRLRSYLPQAVTALFFAALLAALIFRVVQFLAEAWRAINFPFGLDWAEGAVWAEAMLIPGPHMYGPVDVPPFLIFPYPLVYHLAIRGLVALGADPLVAGRALALTCTLVIAGLCGTLVNRAMRGIVSRPSGRKHNHREQAFAPAARPTTVIAKELLSKWLLSYILNPLCELTHSLHHAGDCYWYADFRSSFEYRRNPGPRAPAGLSARSPRGLDLRHRPGL